jgi:hypothetical protein
MHEPALLAFGLREELVSFQTILELARSAPPWEAAQLSRGLASCLDDGQLQALQAALRSRGVQAIALQSRLIERRCLSAALGDPPELSFELFDGALSSLPEADRAVWIALVTSKLARLLERPEATLTKLHGAKVALRYLPAPARARALASITGAFEEEAASGQYGDLELDPTLELARTHASVGSVARALALLEEREQRNASFTSQQEIAECASVLECLPAEVRGEAYGRFLRWARATGSGGEGEGVSEVKWLTATAWAVEHGADADLLRIVSRSTMAEALAEMLRCNALAPAVQEAALERLVTLTETYVQALQQTTEGPSVKDWKRHGTAVRQLGVSVWAIGRYATERPASWEPRLRAAARSWSRWLATQDIAFDSLPHVNTLIAWAPQCREDLAGAIEQVASLGRARPSWFVGLERWDVVLPLDEARELARAALAQPRPG